MIADYGGFIIIKLCLLGVLVIVTFAAPFCVLPSKDGVEELIMKGKKFSFKQNVLLTFIICVMSWAVAIIVPSIGAAMTILGATTNSFIGFIIPIIFYFKIEGDKGGKFTNMKVISYCVATFICISSVITLYTFIGAKINGG